MRKLRRFVITAFISFVLAVLTMVLVSYQVRKYSRRADITNSLGKIIGWVSKDAFTPQEIAKIQAGAIQDENFDWKGKKPIKWDGAKTVAYTNSGTNHVWIPYSKLEDDLRKTAEGKTNAEAEWLQYTGTNIFAFEFHQPETNYFEVMRRGDVYVTMDGAGEVMFEYSPSEGRLYINTDYFVDDGPFQNTRMFIKRDR